MPTDKNISSYHVIAKEKIYIKNRTKALLLDVTVLFFQESLLQKQIKTNLGNKQDLIGNT